MNTTQHLTSANRSSSTSPMHILAIVFMVAAVAFMVTGNVGTGAAFIAIGAAFVAIGQGKQSSRTEQLGS